MELEELEGLFESEEDAIREEKEEPYALVRAERMFGKFRPTIFTTLECFHMIRFLIFPMRFWCCAYEFGLLGLDDLHHSISNRIFKCVFEYPIRIHNPLLQAGIKNLALNLRTPVDCPQQRLRCCVAAANACG